ncbi:MAG: GAF domain-containing protein [Candidatus Methylomirabilales bacterium]
MSTPDAEIQKMFAKSEELLEMLRKGKEFTEQLLKENERLRLRIVQLEKEKRELQERSKKGHVERLAEENKKLTEKLNHLEQRFAEMEQEGLDFAAKYAEVQQQNENLANLYVASYQLHSTLDPDEVIEIVKEILTNLVGVEALVIYVVEKKSGTLTTVAAEGVPPQLASGTLELAPEVRGKVLDLGESYYAENENVHPERGHPLAAIALKIKKEVVGVIALFKLLTQKAHLTSTDHELLNLLAGHAATAIVSSRLYSDAERKLKTIEGFIELLKSE